MSIYDDLVSGRAKLALVGLGYVGMPIAVAFSKHVSVVGYDINSEKVAQYAAGLDPTQEVGDEAIAASSVEFTSDAARLDEASFYIVAVPTPVNADHTPDLAPVVSASHTVGRHLSRGDIVVYESTVYPGVTEEVCVPILEQESGLKCGLDFKVGYSPERINPGDKDHRLENIVKIVSGIDGEALEQIASVYELVVKAGVHRAESIKVAEAAKVIENSQRDINIAFMNELSIIFHKLGIDTKAVLEAAATKWNFLDFKPGLVGGHCIGVDPYYLTHRAEAVGYHSQVIIAGRRINDDMGRYVAENLVKHLVRAVDSLSSAKVAILGFTFKENCPDTRNTRVIDIIAELKEYGIEPIICDPVADKVELERFYNIEPFEIDDLGELDAIVLASAHDELTSLTIDQIRSLYRRGVAQPIFFDVKSAFSKAQFEDAGFDYWRL